MKETPAPLLIARTVCKYRGDSIAASIAAFFHPGSLAYFCYVDVLVKTMAVLWVLMVVSIQLYKPFFVFCTHVF